MRKAFVETVSGLLDTNDRIVLLLGDISVHAFKAAKAKHPMRVINCGVSEQAMVSAAAGLARAGMYPIVHTIAPFLVERALEQIKVDFGYQELPGCFVSIGASYDYGGMGCTHHCPGDVAAMLTIPDLEIYAPGHADEVRQLLPKITDGAFAYVRLSEASNPHASPTVNMAISNWAVENQTAFIVAAGPTVGLVPDHASYFFMGRLDRAPQELRLTPFRKVLVLEPFYVGTLTHLIAEALPGAIIKSIGVPREFLRGYGTRDYFDELCGLTARNVAEQLEALIRG